MQVSVSTIPSNILQEKPISTVRSAIESLPLSYRRIMTLHILEGYRAKDAAQILNTNLIQFNKDYKGALSLLSKSLA